MHRLHFILLALIVFLIGAVPQADAAEDGPLVLYDFADVDSDIVRDRSQRGEALDLRIADTKAVTRQPGSLRIDRDTTIRSSGPATKITRAIRKSGAISVVALVHPHNDRQDGPARIVSLSSDTQRRNFTLGQDGGQYDFRLRSTATGDNGIPSLASPADTAKTTPTHVVYTRDADGRVHIYIDARVVTNGRTAGSLDKWDDAYRLAIGNELTNDRPWRGTLHRVAIYDRALSPDEVAKNFKSQLEMTKRPAAPARPATDVAAHFEQTIAPLLSRHCLECHGGQRTKARLDLTQKAAAMHGGKSGKAIVPGDLDKSLLWESIVTDEMPDGAPPLSTAEKAAVKRWILDGAVWTKDTIEKPRLDRTDTDAQWVQRLTVPEYIDTVRAAVGVDITDKAAELLPRDVRADGFTNTAYNLTVDLGHVRAYAQLAETITHRADTVRLASRFTEARTTDEANIRKLIAGMGAWVWRGPLTDREIESLLPVAKAVTTEGGDFDEAVGYLLRAMLQSPRFLYRIEPKRKPGAPVEAYALANRLSYIIWGGPPDEALLRAAGAGELESTEGIERQAARMLADPRAITRSKRFITEWLNLDRLEHLKPDRQRFAMWNASLASDMRDETLAFFEHVVWKQSRPMTDLLNAQVTFATARLARHYGFKPTGDGLARYDLADVPARGGLLTQGSVLTVGGDEASMVARGLFVLHDVLDGHIDDPPPGIDTTEPPVKPGLSQRDIAVGRINNKACGSCHRKFEPLAFALERFDGLGAYRMADTHGNRLRDDGVIEIPDALAPVRYSSSAELMDLLAGSDRVGRTITAKMIQFSIGRPLRDSDDAAVNRIHAIAKRDGGTWSSIVTTLVTSDIIRKTPQESTEEPRP